MAIFKQIATAYPNAASDTSLTSAFTFATEYEQYAIFVPPLLAVTATCGINVMAYDATTASYYDVVYSNNPATSTSGLSPWASPASAACMGAFVICEALQFTPGQAKLKFLNTVTANTSVRIYGRMSN